MNDDSAPAIVESMSDAPNFSGNYPLAGERVGPAWRDAWAVLDADRGRWHEGGEIARTVATRHGLDPETVSNLLRQARQRGFLTVRRRTFGTPRVRRAEYRIAKG